MCHTGWECADCKVCTFCIHEYYMVIDRLWNKYGVDLDMLCIGCLEERIGRVLVKKDFNKYPINHDLNMIRSNRLKERLGQ